MPIERQYIHSFSKLELLAKQVVEGFITGLHKSPFHGFSVEFAEHRLYNSGESVKHVDWKLFARTEKMFLKRYEEETNLRCQIIIDNSSSMYYPIDSTTVEKMNKITFSVYCAAALIELLKKQRDAVGLSIFDAQLETNTAAKSSPVHHSFLFSELEKLTEKYNTKNIPRTTNLIESLHVVAETTHKRSLIVLFTDMLDSVEDNERLFAALQHLKYNKHEVLLFHVADYDKELNFEFDNRPYRFIDLETKEEITIQSNAVKASYVQAAQSRWNELKLRCGKFGIDFIEADTNKGFDTILLNYLLKRQKMGA